MADKPVTTSDQSKHGLLPTPPLPAGLPKAHLTENARQVLMRRYVRRGEDGKPVETVEEMFWRVAWHVAKVEAQWGDDVHARAVEYYHLLSSKKFFPNSPTFTGAGTPLGQLAACFVLPITDDMGRDSAGIFQTLRDAALIQQTGGGNGFSFSRLRPKGAMVHTSAGQATGPVGFLRVYDHAFGEIAQGGCLLPETLVFTNKGLLRLDEIVDANLSGWQEHRLSVPTDEGTKVSPRGFNNGIADVLRVHTREGLSITGTPNHKVKVMTDAGPQWKEIQDLVKGDWIVVRLGEHSGSLQVLKKPAQKHGNQVMPNLPSILDEELAFFLGYLAGDGFVAQGEDDQRVGVSVAHSSYLMEEMPAMLNRLFGINVHRMQKPNDRSVTFVMDNRAVKEFLHLNGLGKKSSREVSVPRLIRQSPANIVGAYLRGLFEADGTLTHGYPTLTTSSSRLAREVSTLLIGLGCPVHIRTVSAGLDRWGDSETYQIRITSNIGLRAWREKIGCDHRSRFVAAYAWESDLRRESSYVLPSPKYWLQPVLDAITLEQVDKRGRGRNINFRATEPHLRKQILRYMRGDRNLTRSGYDLLKAEHPEMFESAPSVEGFWFVEVGGVEEAGRSLTLDLEVSDNHTYLAYGMVTHNTRRGANMAVLRVDHPDVEEFITCKTDENSITNFNISVGITDAFMRAVKEDKEWELRFPDPKDAKAKGFNGTLEQAEAAGVKIITYGKVRARDIFDKIVKQAHHNGEPGVLFLDAANRSNPVPHLYPLEATNPCGEQWLGPYENCCLGSVNLNEHCGPDGTVDWELLRKSVVTATRFLDDVVEANAYVPAVPQLKEAAHRARRIGLGIMGLADLMYHVGVRYGSREGQEFGSQVMEFVRYHAMLTSIELAKERGAFPAIEGSIYDMDNMTWTPPRSLIPYQHNWGRPEVQWDAVVEGIKKHGIRNAAQTTVAPTGTIATVAGCEGYGCEPVFALAYIRHVNDNGKDLTLTYASPRFDEALKKLGLGEEKRQEIVEQVMRQGTCQHIHELPRHIRDTFVVSSDVTAEEHVRMQAALQAFVDNSLSKTINFPEGATVDDVATAYMLAWELGCKGITVYVTGSRDKVVLETKATAEKKEAPQTPPQPASASKPELAPTFFHDPKKPRPRALTGKTYSVETPVGKAFVTINENGGEQPFEAFINTAKAGSETAAVSEAIGRLISYILRMTSPIKPTDRLREVVRQLMGIGGGRSLGLGPNRVRSLPDGIGQVLDMYLREKAGALPALEDKRSSPDEGKTNGGSHTIEEEVLSQKMRIGDLCPECGEAAVVNEEGCRKCYACGFSEC
ncbi:MAG: adenosylcobalamin-dependent ribonucleoside-diphosphate reductase [Chloroflexota bacterium]